MLFQNDSPPPRIIFSTTADYFHAAQQELHAAFGDQAVIERFGCDTGGFAATGVDIADMAEICQRRPIIFVQHLMREALRVPSDEVADAMQPIAEPALRLLQEQGAAPVALQVWQSAGTRAFRYQPDALWWYIAERLTAHGFTVTRGNQEHILSVCLTPQAAILGLNTQAEALTDWPGGRVGLAKSAAQISRAEFKLEELFKVFAVALPAKGVALDLGASPGGWTHVLRERGLSVWAVDPADLDPRIARDSGVHHARTSARDFLAATNLRFDVVVNDMRMDPALSCRVMLHAARHLKPGGLAIVTLKLYPRNPLETVQRALAILQPSYAILHARQLFHNRHEVTVVARRNTSNR
jgi:23S rRNA (cytidine2498-2'-O)-methyltransferase